MEPQSLTAPVPPRKARRLFPHHLTRDELCADIGVSPRQILRYEVEGMPYQQCGNVRLYKIDEIREWFIKRPHQRKRSGPQSQV